MPPARFLYLHGFASSPASQKAQEFTRRLAALGVELQVPALDEGDFRGLTLSRMRAVAERTMGPPGEGPPWVIFGSSLGGYLAALVASERDDVARLILMAPAFDFARRFAARLGEEGLRRWRESGALLVRHHATGRDEPLGPSIIEDAARHPPFPEVRCSTVIFHGRRDQDVPVDVSEEYARRRKNVDLVLLDDEHALTARFESVWAYTRIQIAPFLPRPGAR